MTDLEKPKQKSSWLRRCLLILVIAAIAGLAGLRVASSVTERMLLAEVTKIKQAGEPVAFSDLKLQTAQIPANIDARTHYEKALAEMKPEAIPTLMQMYGLYQKAILGQKIDSIPETSRASTTRMLVSLQQLTAKIDRASTLSLSDFDIGVTKGLKEVQDNCLRAETAVALLSLRTMELIAQDRPDDAAKSIISSLKLLRIFDCCPTIGVQSARTKSLTQTCQNIAVLLSKIKPSEASLAQLQQVLSEVIAEGELKRIFLAERAYQVQIAQKLMPEKKLAQLLNNEVYNLPECIKLPNSSLGRLQVRYRSLDFFKNMAKLVSIASKPWPEPLGKIKAPSTKASGSLESGAAKLVQLTAHNIRMVNSMTMAIACERYKLKHGKAPEPIDAVVGEFIDSIPIDPQTGEKIKPATSK